MTVICIGRPTIDRAANGEMVEVGQGVTIMAADDLHRASPYAEVDHLRQREAEALKLLHNAFGEYACMIKAHLSETEIALFEANFAVPARAFIGAKRFGR